MSNITRSIPLDQLREWKLPDSREIVVSSEIEDVGRRWMDVCTVVFKAPDDGLHYSFCYDVGKTEYQECSWDEELDDPLPCTRVELRQIKVDKWLPVESEDGES